MKDIFYKKFLQILFVINTMFDCYAAPEVSVIIPIYNTEKELLIQCLDSVTNQTLSNIEIICIDDGSTNVDTISTLDNYAKRDPRIVVMGQKNQGMCITRNKGIDVAQAKYISFVDSDDYIHPQMLEIMTALAKDGDVDVVISSYQMVTNNTLFDFPVSYEIPVCNVMYDFKKIVRWVGPFHHAWNKLYAKSAIASERFNDEAFSCEDIEFNLRVFGKNIKNYKMTDIPLYYYRMNNSSIIRSPITKRRMDALCYLVEKVWYEDNGLLSIENKHDIIEQAISYFMKKTVLDSSFEIFLYAVQKINDLSTKGIITFRVFNSFFDKMKLAMFISVGKLQSAWIIVKELF